MYLKNKQILIVGLLTKFMIKCKSTNKEEQINPRTRVTKLLKNYKNSDIKDVILAHINYSILNWAKLYSNLHTKIIV